MKTEIISALSGILIGFGDPLIKYSMNTSGINDFLIFDFFHLSVLFSNWLFLLGIFIAVIGSIIYVVSLSRGKASIVNPLSGGASYVTLVVLSTFMLGESLTIQKIIGMSIIVFGIYLISKFYSEPSKINITKNKDEVEEGN
ncbi:MAG: EamA family transporter [Candidatus Odinarchaeia archaeon]